MTDFGKSITQYNNYYYYGSLISIIIIYRWRVFDVGDPYIAYRINVTVQQVDYTATATKSKNDDSTKTVWKTIGYATIGPQMHIDNTNRKKPGVTSGPQVYTYGKIFSTDLKCEIHADYC